MPAVRTPEASQPTRRIAVSGCSLPRREIGSATSITFDFGANPPFTCVPACNLSVYASQWLLPDTTQDSIHGCLAQALPWPPFQTAELNALARRNPLRTGHDDCPSSGSSLCGGEEIPGRTEHPILVSPDERLSTPVLRSVQLAPSKRLSDRILSFPE